jgi:Ca2+-binding EF-hand superfamily protein
MISRRNAILAAITGLAGVGAAHCAFAKKPAPAASFDTDNDGTVDLAEAKKAASDLFDKLDTDKDGTLDIKELQGRLSRKDFATADPDKDKTLTKDEYLAAVEKRFKAADPDNDGTVSAAEFRTASGQALARLLH